jgi:hypothetical protein
MSRVLTVVCVVALSACQFKFDRKLDPGEIRGHLVFASADGSRVAAAGATIRIENSSVAVHADTAGHFVVRQLQAGTYALNLTASFNGSPRGLRIRNLTLTPGSNGLAESRDLGEVTLAEYGSLSGTVTGTANPVTPGTVVTLPGFARMDVTAGAFRSPNLVPGDYDVMLFSPRDSGAIVAGPITVSVKPGAAATTDFNLDQFEVAQLGTGSIAGQAVLVGPGTNSQISVSLLPTPSNFTAALTDDSGLYTLPAIDPGVYTVVAELNTIEASVPFVVVGGTTTNIPTITLQLDESQTVPADDAGTDAGSTDAGDVDGGDTDAGQLDAGTDAGSDAGSDAGTIFPSDGGTCPQNLTNCGGVCVNLESDNNNCGACSNVCAPIPTGLSGSCQYNACVVLLDPNTPGADSLVADTTDVYWHGFNPQVLKHPLTGGTQSTFADQTVGGNAVTGVALDDTNVYWSGLYSIYSKPKAGGATTTIATAGSGINQRLVVDATSVYWANSAGILKAPLTGGAPTTLVAGVNAYGLGVDGLNVYWTEPTTGIVGSVSKLGGQPATFASGQSNPYDIVLQSPYVYWVNYSDAPNGAVLRKMAEGGSITTMSTNAEANFPKGLAADSNFVYWGNYGTGTIFAAPTNGLPAFRITAEQANPYSMAVTATHLYWSEPGKIAYAPLPVPQP